MSIKKTLGIIASVALGCFNPANATPEYFQEHEQLIHAVESVGVTVQINSVYCNGSFQGMYEPERRVVTICQDYGTQGGPEVSWTEDDLNTLRHEAHHVTQGCMIGHNNDGLLGRVYFDPDALVQSQLSSAQVRAIISRYRAAGFDNYVINLELEAFAVAEMNDAAEQVKDINRFCF